LSNSLELKAGELSLKFASGRVVEIAWESSAWGCPQFEQNFAAGSKSEPQFEHTWISGVPQLEQNFALFGLGDWQLLQYICIIFPRLPGEYNKYILLGFT